MKIRRSLPLAAFAFLFFSCATRIPYPESADAASFFPGSPAAYVRLERPLLEDAGRTLLAPRDFRSARPFLARTDLAILAVSLPGTAAAARGTPSFQPDEGVSLYGIAQGSYPSGAAGFRLRLSREWKKKGRSLVNDKAGLRIAFAGRSLLAASNGDLEPLLDQLASPGPHPVPEDLRPLWETPCAVWIARPASLLAALGTGATALPARSILFSLSMAPGGYSGVWVFDFEDERSARIYGPLCRLLHLAWIRAQYGPDLEAANAELDRTVWSVSGNRISASGFSLRGPDLFRALSESLVRMLPQKL